MNKRKRRHSGKLEMPSFSFLNHSKMDLLTYPTIPGYSVNQPLAELPLSDTEQD